MSKLIDELKNDHVRIIDELNKVNELGVTTKEGQDKLISARTGLIAHLKKEDEKLYPALRMAAEKDEDIKQIVDTFAKDMDVVSAAAFEFFGQYSGGGSGMKFAMDFGRFFGTFKTRMRKEENILYQEYEKLNV